MKHRLATNRRCGRALLTLALLCGLISPALATTPTRCTTYDEKTLGRRHTVCDDGTRAVSTYNKTLSRWETTITASPRQACTGRLNPKTHQWEGRCR